jgi:hypothetical protein
MTIMSPMNTCPVRWLFKSSTESILGDVILGLLTVFEHKK